LNRLNPVVIPGFSFTTGTRIVVIDGGQPDLAACQLVALLSLMKSMPLPSVFEAMGNTGKANARSIASFQSQLTEPLLLPSVDFADCVLRHS